MPRRAEIAVPTRAPEDLGNIRFVARPARAARARAGLNPTEVALLEVLASWASAIELPPDEAWTRLLEVVASRSVRPERIARAARTEPASTRARLPVLLRAAGHIHLADRIPEPDVRTTAAATRVLAVA